MLADAVNTPWPFVPAGLARRTALVAAILGSASVLGSTATHAQTPGRPAVAMPAPRETFAQVSTAATAAREAERREDAVALYRRAIAMRPSWDEGQWHLGSLLYELGRCAEARPAFAQVLRVHPRHAAAVAMGGLCEFQLGSHDAALRHLLQARQLNIQRTPEIATVVRYHAGILLTRFGEFEAGNQVLTELAAEGQESAQAIDAFGLNVLRMPMLPAEIPAEARARVQLAGRAGFAMAARQATQAGALLEQLVADYGEVPHVHYVRGVFLLASHPAQALEAFQREIAVSPSHVPARLQIAFELLKQGDAGAAKPWAAQAVAIDPEAFAPRLALGQVHLDQGNTAAAISEFEHGVRLAPGSPQPHYLLAVAYARAGRPADADRARAEFTRLSR